MMRKVEVDYRARRLKELPPYLFVEMDRIKKRLIQEGKDIIDLSIGDPDLATPGEVIEELYIAAQDPQSHRYPLDKGISELRYEISEWFLRRFGVELDPEEEILPLIGSKEGIAHFPLAVIDPGDLVLIPEPHYPPYRSGALFAGAKVLYLPLREERDFLPDLEGIDKKVLRQAKLLYLNYPNNPTTAVVEREFLEEVVKIAREFGIIILYDAAYSELCYDGYMAPSILEVDGAKEIAIEFHSFSKTYNMTGWRIGWACGSPKLIEPLRQVKANIDSGIFTPIQYAGIKALRIYDKHIEKIRSIYKERRDIFVNGLGKIGWEVYLPKATFYVWAKVPLDMDSMRFSKLLLEECRIIATPGIGFGPSGEGYLRFSLTTDKERLEEAVDRIAKVL